MAAGYEKDTAFVRAMLAFAAERIMETEVEALTGAAKGERSPLRDVQRNGYRRGPGIPARDSFR